MLNEWLKAKLDSFELRIRSMRTKQGKANNDCYYNSGWAHGYIAAQRDARKAARIDAANARIGG